ncbi:MAG: S4 domain-containing protein [candidate division WOR-3 bacterium]
MRIDKLIQILKFIKSRNYANLACRKGYVYANGKIVKASYRVKKGDKIKIDLVDRCIEFEVLDLPQKNFKKEELENFIRIINYTYKKNA